MAGVKISALPAVASALSTDYFPVVQGGATSRETLLQISALFGFNNSVGIGQLGLAAGGTNANITASNGGIVYSTASAMAVLSGTATAGKMLQSGSSAAPTWSTSTWPATTTINQILYSSAANTVAGLATANSKLLTTDGSGVPSFSNDFITGTFTPTITGSSVNPTSITYSTQVGEYTKIGNVVYFNIRVDVSAITMGGAAGNLQITGLPYPSVNNAVGTPGGCWIGNTAFTGSLASNVAPNAQVVNVIESATGAAITIMPVTSVTASTAVSVSGHYFTT